jgi:hypothetical protein
MSKPSFRICSAWLLLGASAGFASAVGGASGDNLVSNSGFEIARWNAPAAWRLSEGAQGNTFDWISGGLAGNDVHSGDRSLRMNALRQPAPERSMDATTNVFRVPPHARVEASVWLKASAVATQEEDGGYGLRVTLTARSGSGVKIEHRDLMNEQGSFSWKKIQGGMIVPEGAAVMDLSIKLTTCTGTVWIDDADVRVVEELSPVDLDGVRNPVVIPCPWQSRLRDDKLPLHSVAIANQRPDPRIRDAVDSLFTGLGLVHDFLTGNDAPPGRYATQLILGDSAHPALAREFYLRFPNATWADLEEQGYFLAVVPGAQQNLIYLGANSHIGRFYALQTLQQLIQGRSIYVADILDRPTVTCRGIPMGLQWFEQRNGEALKRLTQLKLNFVWAQGSFLNDCLSTDNWRLDFTLSQKAAFKGFIELYQKNFIDVWIAFGPRGKNPPLQYSSAADIDTIVHKMDVLYTLGLRNFGLRFDDLGNVGEDRLLVAQDISAFNGDIGAAQVYFIYEVYSRLKSLHPDIKFMVVPLDYSQTGNHRGQTQGGLRLRQYRKLPADIGIYSVSYYDEDILAATCLTGRPTVTVVSNFYSEGIEDRNEYAVPVVSSIGWQDGAIRSRISGFTWLPKIPQREDAALISWRTMADFAWAPERYDPQRSFQLAAAQYLGVSDKTPATIGAGLP